MTSARKAAPGAAPAAEPDRNAADGADRKAAPQERGEQANQEQVTSHAERITLAISVTLLLAVVGLLVYLYVTGGDQPAAIQVTPQLQELRQEGGLFYLPVVIQNTGDHTASSVQVELLLSASGGEEESSQFTIQFLAGQDTQRAVAAFRHDPSQGELTTSISYVEP